MPNYKAPLQDMRFLLHRVFKGEQFLATMAGTAELKADLLDAILEECARLAEQLLSPLNRSGDETGCVFEAGAVRTPAGFRQAYETFAAGGWGALTGDPDYGGQGMPKLLSVLFEEMLFAANSSFTLYPILTNGACLALSLHGSAELKQLYLPRLYSGQWSGTMCLTESHAGTDLGIMKTRAERQPDGSYRLDGSKIFITAGEHDLTENIIHFVLAKLPGSPERASGTSLFLVPKFLVDDQGRLGKRNGVVCGSIEHKMGIRASATCVLNFDGATAYLVGEENRGLACMFTMMNYERLSMGLQGIGLADYSYQIARDYARQRIQGRAPGAPANPGQSADPIIVHPDVRRMLLTMRANVMAGRALALYVASKLDTVKFSDDAAGRDAATQLVELLTPVVKAFCTDRGFQDCVLGQQVLGGHGYIREWGQEQNVRDARIAQIYEGANGIQALDLMGRKTARCGGAYLATLLAEIEQFITHQPDDARQAGCLRSLAEACADLRNITDEVLERTSSDAAEIGAASYPYMEILGLVLFAYMWARIMAAATEADADATGFSAEYRDSLSIVGDFYFKKVLPRYRSLIEEVRSGADPIMRLAAEHF